MIGKRAGIKEEFPEEDLSDFGITWWGKQWIGSMLSAGRHFRMQRGIIYARDNRISDVIINKGEIFAQCQGTAPVPYRIKLKFQILNETQWQPIIQNLSESILYESSLLFGELPQDMDTIFKKCNASLFPEVGKSLDAECSCPDKAVPCKHIASLILTLAKVFDYDPLLLLRLRGMDKEELFHSINANLYAQIPDQKQVKPQEIKEDKTAEKPAKKSDKKSKKTKQTKEEKVAEQVPISHDKGILPSITFNIEDFRDTNYILTLFQKSSLAYEINSKKEFSESLLKIYKASSSYVKDLMYKAEE
jgi:uncharacterized Zn finger protein